MRLRLTRRLCNRRCFGCELQIKLLVASGPTMQVASKAFMTCDQSGHGYLTWSEASSDHLYDMFSRIRVLR